MASTDAPMCNICNNKHGRGEKHVWAGSQAKDAPKEITPKASKLKAVAAKSAVEKLTPKAPAKKPAKVSKLKGKAKAAKASKPAAKRDITPKKPKPKMEKPPITRASKLVNLSEDERIARRLEQKREAVRRFRAKKEGASA